MKQLQNILIVGIICLLQTETSAYVLLRVNKSSNKNAEIDEIINRLVSSKRFTELADQIAEKAAMKFRNFKSPYSDNENGKPYYATEDFVVDNSNFDENQPEADTKPLYNVDEPIPERDREPENFDIYTLNKHKINGKYYDRARGTVHAEDEKGEDSGVKDEDNHVNKEGTSNKENEDLKSSSSKNVRLLYYRGAK